MDGRNLRCSTIGSCQSTAISYNAAGRGIAAVSSAIEESDLYLLHHMEKTEADLKVLCIWEILTK